MFSIHHNRQNLFYRVYTETLQNLERFEESSKFPMDFRTFTHDNGGFPLPAVRCG